MARASLPVRRCPAVWRGGITLPPGRYGGETMRDNRPPHESEEFQRALELLATYGSEESRFTEGDAILKRMIAEGRDPIPDALENGDDRTRFLVTRNLQVMGPLDYRDELIARLDDPVDEVRLWAVWALEFYDEDPPVDAMICALNDIHPRVRDSAAWNLGWFGDPRALNPLLARARVVDGDEVQPVRDALSSLTATALYRIVRALKREEGQARRIMADALANAATDVVVCGPVEDRLGWTRDTNDGSHARPAVPAMIEMLDDADEEVRSSAFEFLWLLSDTRAHQRLMELSHHEDPHVRALAVWALSDYKDAASRDRIREALRDPKAIVRVNAVDGLHGLDEDTVPFFIEALRDLDPKVRLEAAWGLACLEDSRAREALCQALDDEDPEVREVARDALDRLPED